MIFNYICNQIETIINYYTTMKKHLFLALALSMALFSSAQNNAQESPEEEGFVFTTVKEIPITEVRNHEFKKTGDLVLQYENRIMEDSYTPPQIKQFGINVPTSVFKKVGG